MSNTIDEEVSNNVCGICNSEAAPNIKKCTSCDQKIREGVCDNNSRITNTTSSIEAVSIDIDNMIISNNNNNNNITSTGAADSIAVCANCGKEGDDVNNICNKCEKVKYCNAVCKKVHKKKHKKQCEEYQRLAVEKHNEELRIAAELHDEKLFKQPPPKEVCPICFLRIPSLTTGYRHMSCCGQVLCNGCCYAPVYDNQGNKVDNEKCPFCRIPWHDTDEEQIKRLQKRIEANDNIAIGKQGNYYQDGTFGFPQDYTKAFELLHRAGELGNARAYSSIGNAYYFGEGVRKDEKKATYYYELAAIRGVVLARYNLGQTEKRSGNMHRALKHYMIAVRDGGADSLTAIQRLYSNGYATKDDYAKALQSYQTYLGEIKSDQRDKVAAADEELFGYY